MFFFFSRFLADSCRASVLAVKATADSDSRSYWPSVSADNVTAVGPRCWPSKQQLTVTADHIGRQCQPTM